MREDPGFCAISFSLWVMLAFKRLFLNDALLRDGFMLGSGDVFLECATVKKFCR